MERGETNVTGQRLAELERAAARGFPPERAYLAGYEREPHHRDNRLDPALLDVVGDLPASGLVLDRGAEVLLHATALVALGPARHRDLVRALRHGHLARVVRGRDGGERIEVMNYVRDALGRRRAERHRAAEPKLA